MTPDRVPTPQPDLLSPSPANAPPVEVLPAEALQTLYYAPVEVRQQVRMLVRNEEPWWVANDICARLGLSNPRKAVGDLDEDEKGVTTGDTLGGPQEMLIINESGLYSLILRSRKP
jgi:prophage antirepressor-like protein